MNTKKRLMIDMDDVIVHGGFLYLINEFTNKHYIEEDFQFYYMQDIIPADKKEEWKEFFRNNNIYEKASFIGTAHDSLKRLNEKYEIFITTAYIMRDDTAISGKVLKDKFAWLQENLPFINPMNYVFTNNKDVVNCDIKIDDRLSNLTGNNTKLLFTAYHNKGMSDDELKTLGVQRVNGWEDVEKVLL